MARRQSFAGLVKGEAGEKAWLFRIRSGGSIDSIFGEDRLNLVPQDLIDNWLMLSRVCISPMCDLAAIDAVSAASDERAPRESFLTTKRSAVCQYHAACSEFPRHQVLPAARARIGALHIAGRYGRPCASFLLVSILACRFMGTRPRRGHCSVPPFSINARLCLRAHPQLFLSNF